MATVYRIAAIQAARIAGQSTAMDIAAQGVAATARSLAASHNVSGEFINGIGVSSIAGKRGVTDRIAYVDHSAAFSVEFGHMTRLGKGQHGPRRFVEGLHIMARAAGRL